MTPVAAPERVQPRWNKYMPIFVAPDGTEGPSAKQAAFLSPQANMVREIMFGGAAGGGKSVALLYAALQYVDVPGYAALLLRRTYKDLNLPGALMSMAEEWLSLTDAKWVASDKMWVFPSGATLSFGYLEGPRDHLQYQSSEFQFIGFDELTQFSEKQYRFLFSRLRRKTRIAVPLRMRSASNPGGPGHEWVRDRFITGSKPTRAFIPSKLGDNPFIDRASYLESLSELDPVTLQQLLNGDWTARETGGWFDRDKVTIVDDLPRGMRSVRYWDLAGTKPNKSNDDPDWTAGCWLGRTDNGDYYVLDMRRMRGNPHEVERALAKTAEIDGHSVPVFVEQEPGSSGKFAEDHLRRVVLAGYNYTPDRATGSKRVRAQPVAATWNGGNFFMKRGEWNSAFLDELEAFGWESKGHDDQVDALSGAFSRLGRRRDAYNVAQANDDLGRGSGVGGFGDLERRWLS